MFIVFLGGIMQSKQTEKPFFDKELYENIILNKAKKNFSNKNDIEKVVDEIIQFHNTDIEVINAAFDRLKKRDLDSEAIKAVQNVINDGVIENQFLELIVPFLTDDTAPYYNQVEIENFEAVDFSSPRLCKVVNDLFYRTGGHDGAAEIVRVYNYIEHNNDILDCEMTFEEQGINYTFKTADIKLFAFEKHINFLTLDVELVSADGLPPSLCDIIEFSSIICRVRDDIKRFNSTEKRSFREVLNIIIGSYNPIYIGNNNPKSIEEKPRIFGSAILKYAFSDQKIMEENLALLSNNLSASDIINIKKEDKNYKHTQNGALMIANNGVYSISSNNALIQYRQEYLISYLLCLYEYYARLLFLEHIGIGNFMFDEGNIDKTLEKILDLKNEYVMFKVSSVFDEYTRIDRINDDVYYWKSYFNKKNNKEKFEQELSELEEVFVVLEKKAAIKKSKANERRTKKLEVIAVLITSVLMFFSITEGIFKLYDRLASITDNIYNLVKIGAAFVIWIAVLIITVKKTKK